MNRKYPQNLCQSQGGIIHKGKGEKRRRRGKRRGHTLWPLGSEGKEKLDKLRTVQEQKRIKHTNTISLQNLIRGTKEKSKKIFKKTKNKI